MGGLLMPIFFERVKDEAEGLALIDDIKVRNPKAQLIDNKTGTLKDTNTILRLTKDLSSGKCVVRRYERFK